VFYKYKQDRREMLLQSKLKHPKTIEAKKKEHELWMTLMNVKHFGEKSV